MTDYYFCVMLSVIKETKDYIVVNKPGGLITESNPFEDSLESQVFEYLSKTNNRVFLGVVHRLDRVTSGVVLFAKKKSALKYFNGLFETKQIQKTYLAIGNSSLPKPRQNLSHYLVKDNRQKKAIITDHKVVNSKNCELKYLRLGVSNTYTLVKVLPKTGRFHQIRAQLSYIGFPIYGDQFYGSENVYKALSVCLHAYILEFTDFGSNEKVKVLAPIPEFTPWDSFSNLLK